MPVCKRCQDHGNECIYQQSRRGYKGPRKTAHGVGDSSSIDENVNLMRSQEATSIEAWTPTSTGIDFDMIEDDFDTFPIRAPQSTNTTIYDQSYESGQISQNISISGQPAPISDVQDKQLAISSHQNAGDLPMDPSAIANDILVDSYYANFNGAHPFIIPQRLYRTKPSFLPPILKTVIQFVASHFIPNSSQDSLRDAAQNITSDQIPADGYKVQGLILFGMSLFARCEQENALAVVDQAINLALNLGMNSKNFAISHGMGDKIIEESWRRTWWELYMVDGILSSLNSVHHLFRLQNVQSDVPLPCEEPDYARGKITALLRSQNDFMNRTFAAEEYDYSSLAYKIEAVRLLGQVVNISIDVLSPTDEQVESLEASLANFTLSLPSSKRHSIYPSSQCDEILFSAHNLIDSALISLHRPRSSLTFVQNHYPTACTRPEATRTPITAYDLHTAKALSAANSISKAIALRTVLSKHSPCFICATLLSAIVHLPAYSIEIDTDRANAMKERLQLTINALNAIGEIWPMARAAKAQISQFARDVFAGQAMSMERIQAEERIRTIDIESMMGDQTWLDELANWGPRGGEKALLEGNPLATVGIVAGEAEQIGGKNGMG